MITLVSSQKSLPQNISAGSVLRLINLVCERSLRIANYFLFSVMDTASHTGAIMAMGVMLATMGAMEAMAMVAIMVLDTDIMVESDVAMGTVPLCPALLENRKIRNIYIFFREITTSRLSSFNDFFPTS